MGFGLILAGLIFLFSPDLGLVDVLPDVIGWFLIYLGMYRLADMEMRAEDSKKRAKLMILVSAVKLVIAPMTFRFNTDSLLAAFSYAIVELIIVLPLVSDFFLGLDYSAMRVGASLNSDKLNLAKWYLWFFFVLKHAFSALPAVTALFDSEVTGDYGADSWFVDYQATMRMLMLFAFLLSAVMAVIMLVHFIPFWVRIIRNKELISALTEHRRVTVLEVPSKMLKKNTGLILSFMIPACVLFFDFYLDGVDLLPTFAGFLCLLVSGIFIKRRLGLNATFMIAVSAVGTAVSLGAFLYRTLPLARNKFVMDYAFSTYTYTLFLAALNAAAVILALVAVFKTAKELGTRYLKDGLQDSIVLYIAGGVIIAFFDFVLYAYPQLNTTFVFPSLVFGSAFSALTVTLLIRLGKRIKQDNKD